MTTDEELLLKKHGITTEQKIIYLYKGYRYDHLKDAISFAIIDTEKNAPATK